MNNKDQTKSLYGEWKASNDTSKRDEILHRMKPVITSALKTYGGNDNTLKTRAYIIASDAINTYDPSKNVKLESHVYNNLKKLTRYRNERNTAIHIPENVRADSMTVYRFMDDFRNTHDREPSLMEISDSTGLPYKRIAKARSVGKEKNVSQFANEKGDVTIGEKRSYADIWKDYIYHDLDPINQKIFEWSTGYQGSDTLSRKEIAERLNMSPSAVSQRVEKIVDQVRKGMTG